MAVGTVGATAIVVLVAINQSNTSAALVTSVTDTAGNTYTKATNSTGVPNVAGNVDTEIWYKLGPATSSSSQTYTVHTGSAAPSMAMRVVVLGATTTLDATATLASSSVATNSLTLTTAASDEFVLTAVGVGTNTVNTAISAYSPGDFPVVVASVATASQSSQLLVIFESRPGARAVQQNFSQTGTGTYTAAAVAIGAPLAASATTPAGAGYSLTSEFVKDPGSYLDYVFNWAYWLQSGETISSFAVNSDPGLSVDYSSAGPSYVTAWISGGVSGNEYNLTCSITTSSGRTDNRSIVISAQNK